MMVPDPHMPTGERTKLLDFGIAKLDERGGPAGLKTRIGQVLGTPTYMSPEQCEGADTVGDKSDVYSLGVMLFELLAGQPPFWGDTDRNILKMHLEKAPPSLRKLVTAVSPPLAELVQLALAKQIEARPTMRQMAATLERLAAGQPVAKRMVSSQASPSEVIEFPDATLFVGQQNPPPAAAPSVALPPASAPPAAAPPVRASATAPTDATLYVGTKKPQSSSLGLSGAQTFPHGQKPRQWGMILAGTLGAAAVLTWLAWQQTHRPGEPQRQFPVPVTQASNAPERHVTLRVDSEPTGALVVRIPDGQVLGQTPWQMTQPATESRLMLRLRLHNHEDQELSLATNIDQQSMVHLVPQRPGLSRTAGGSIDKRKLEHSRPAKGNLAVPMSPLSSPRIVD